MVAVTSNCSNHTESMNTSCEFDNTPNDVVGMIFDQLLTSFESLKMYAALSLTCKKFHKVLQDKGIQLFRPFIENHATLRSEVGPETSPGSNTFSADFKKVELYTRLVERYASKLKICQFVGYQSLRAKDFCKIVQSMPDLTVLSWSYCLSPNFSLDDQLSTLSRCTKLQRFYDSCESSFIEEFIERYWRTIAKLSTLASITFGARLMHNPELYNFQTIHWPHLRHLGFDFSHEGAFHYSRIEFAGEDFHLGLPNALFKLDPFLHRLVDKVEQLPSLTSVHFLTLGIEVKSNDTTLSKCLDRLMARLSRLENLEKIEFKLRLRVLHPSQSLDYPCDITVKQGTEQQISFSMDGCTYRGPFAGYLPHGKGKLFDSAGAVVFSGQFKNGIMQNAQGLHRFHGDTHNPLSSSRKIIAPIMHAVELRRSS